MITTMSETFDSAAPANTQEEQNRSTPLFPSSMPLFYEDKPHKSKKKGKKARKKAAKRARKRATERQIAQANYRCGYLSAENEMLRKMLVLAVSVKRGSFNDKLANAGLKLLPKGDR